MQLLDLPPELTQAIIREMVNTVGVCFAVRLRLISKLFDHMVVYAILQGPYLYTLLPMKWFEIGTSFKQKFFKHCIAHDPQHKTQVSQVVQKAIHIFEDASTSLQEGTSECAEKRQKCIDILCYALASRGMVKDYRDLAKSTEPWDDPNEERNAAIVIAAGIGDVKVLKEFLKDQRRIPWCLEAKYFVHPVRAAVKFDHWETVKFLHNTAAIGYIAMLDSCANGNEEIVRQLLANTSWSIRPEHEDAFWEAVRAGYGNTSRSGYGKTASMLLQYGVITESNGYSETLDCAICDGCEEVINLALDAGADVNFSAFPNYRNGFLEKAALAGRKKILQLLLDRGFDRSPKRRIRNALVLAAMNGHMSIVQLLLDEGVDINSTVYMAIGTNDTYTALSGAARNNELRMVRFLLDRGVDIHQNRAGMIGLRYACERGHLDMAQLLIKAGVDINGTLPSAVSSSEELIQANNPVLSAMRGGQDRMLQMLIRMGAIRVDVGISVDVDHFFSGDYPIQSNHSSQFFR